MQFDVFISHASEDKASFVRQLAKELTNHRLHVWYDEFSLKLGDSLSESIDRGLANSKFGIVVLSPSFIKKPWTKRELQGLVSRQIADDRKVILPIWHEIEYADVVAFSPPLADTYAANSANGVEALAQEISTVVAPHGDPLTDARKILTLYGVQTPPFSDIWWINVVERKEAEFKYPYHNPIPTQWMFPLPHDRDWEPKPRGENIASTALQLDWIREAHNVDLSQLDPPEVIQEFIDHWPGLRDTALRCPDVLALYAPQITIPGFDAGFEDAFDKLLDPNNKTAYQMPGYGGPPKTVDDKPALCGELISWRHPSFGNYANHELASAFVNAHTGEYYRAVHSGFDCLIWLLSSNSRWLPDKLRDALLSGFLEDAYVWMHRLDSRSRDNQFVSDLYTKTPSRFRVTRGVRSALEELVEESRSTVKLAQSATSLADEFLSYGLAEASLKQRTRR